LQWRKQRRVTNRATPLIGDRPESEGSGNELQSVNDLRKSAKADQIEGDHPNVCR